jgi:CheY-like chemotaxis protein
MAAAVRAAARSILVVEDDPDIRYALCEILRDEGYEVRWAVHGRDALMQLRGGARPELILLDVMMPVMSGFDFRAAQLEDPELASIPVVVMTADVRHDDATAALKAAAGFGKPFDLDALLAAVARLSAPRPRLYPTVSA